MNQGATPAIAEAAAWRKLSRARFWRPMRRERLELAWWPHYRIEYEVMPPAARGNAPSPRRLLALVDGRDLSQVQLWSAELTFTTDPSGMQPAALVAPEQALHAADAALSRAVWARSGWRRPWSYRALSSPGLVYWPLWVYYHQGALGILGCDLLDAVRGARCGGKLRQAFLAALADAHPANSRPADPACTLATP